jgi:nitrate reductase gamma subunit
VMGHIVGLLIPQVWTNALGLTPHVYHVIALAGGIPAGIAAVAGLAILVYRRRTTGPVFSATTVNDKVMYAVLGTVIVLGMWNTVAGSLLQFGGEYNYREGVSVWFRSIFLLQPEPELMAQAPLGFQLHALLAFLLFAMWPFTRLVHVFSAPIGYLTRPYLVYRSKDARPGRGSGNRAPQRGWDKPELTKK